MAAMEIGMEAARECQIRDTKKTGPVGFAKTPKATLPSTGHRLGDAETVSWRKESGWHPMRVEVNWVTPLQIPKPKETDGKSLPRKEQKAKVLGSNTKNSAMAKQKDNEADKGTGMAKEMTWINQSINEIRKEI